MENAVPNAGPGASRFFGFIPFLGLCGFIYIHDRSNGRVVTPQKETAAL
jgi:hypothetical protein